MPEDRPEDRPDTARRRRLLRTLGVLTFLVIVAVAAAVTGVTSFDVLQRHEEAVNATWDDVRAVQDERRILVARLAETDSFSAALQAVLDRWRLRQRALDTAVDLESEVEAQGEVDAVIATLTSFLERSGEPPAVTDRTSWREQLAELNQAAAVARRVYNESVAEYDALRRRIPHRWFARLFGFTHFPEYAVQVTP